MRVRTRPAGHESGAAPDAAKERANRRNSSILRFIRRNTRGVCRRVESGSNQPHVPDRLCSDPEVGQKEGIPRVRRNRCGGPALPAHAAGHEHAVVLPESDPPEPPLPDSVDSPPFRHIRHAACENCSRQRLPLLQGRAGLTRWGKGIDDGRGSAGGSRSGMAGPGRSGGNTDRHRHRHFEIRPPGFKPAGAGGQPGGPDRNRPDVFGGGPGRDIDGDRARAAAPVTAATLRRQAPVRAARLFTPPVGPCPRPYRMRPWSRR